MFSRGIGLIKERRNILLLVDMYNWSFHNIAKNIQSNIKEHDIDILTTQDYKKRLQKSYNLRYTNNHKEKQYTTIIFLFPSNYFNVSELQYIKKYNNAKIYFCLYDNFIWREINTIPSLQLSKKNVSFNIYFWLKFCDILYLFLYQ